MVLLVGLGYRDSGLLFDEFVRPVGDLVQSAGAGWEYRHYSGIRGDYAWDHDAVILCGTALKDRGYLGEVDRFDWLSGIPVPVLGICAGMQVISLVFGGGIVEAAEVGMVEVRTLSPHPLLPRGPSFQAWELHRCASVPPPGWTVLAESGKCVQAIAHPDLPIYGVLFHPEVRNGGVVRAFVSLARRAAGEWRSRESHDPAS
ncbi:MAG: glutamine amidotransferase [Methanolinea sp.]|nr:glutamine amidotransferase [Methanolinea sp.]